MTQDVQDRLHKLPKWAQELIEAQDRRVEGLKHRLRELGGVVETDTYVDDHVNSKHNLPNGSGVTFQLGETWQDAIECRIHRTTYEGDFLYISAKCSRLEITPQASNAIRCRVIR